MPRPKVDPWWILKIHEHAAAGHKAPTIHKLLHEDGKAAKRKDRPSRRTVDNYYADWVHLVEREPAAKAEQQLFHWPDAMESGALPWEASAAGLELLRFSDEGTGRRPVVREVKWYYRLALAAPSLFRGHRYFYARVLALDEYAKVAGLSVKIDVFQIEMLLAYHSWESEENAAAFLEAMRRHGYSPESLVATELGGVDDLGWFSEMPTFDKVVTGWTRLESEGRLQQQEAKE